MMSEKQFVNGLWIKEKVVGTGDNQWKKLSLSIKEDIFSEFIAKNVKGDGFVNIDIKTGKNGLPYAELDTWQPKEQATETATETAEEPDSDIPF